jgi:hypothetical protein
MTPRLHFFAAGFHSAKGINAHNDIGTLCADVRRDGR